MEESKERVRELEQQFEGMIEDIDKSYLRKLQGDMHRCAANCCDNQSYSLHRVQNCVDNCNSSLDNAQQFVQSEIGRLQNRWTRCIMECNDKMRDNMGVEKSKANLSKDAEKCASKCIDTQLDLMHTVAINMKRALASGKYNGQI